MNTQTMIAFTAIAGLSIASPGPAILLTVRNGATWGTRSVAWSAFGNVSGVFCLSAAAMLGLGVMLQSSALLFGAVKLCGALYLFYLGLRQLFGRAPVLAGGEAAAGDIAPSRRRLYGEAFLTAATNPKALMFFTALFPQFVDAQEPLLPQFLILTSIFMTVSYLTHLAYAALASRAGRLLCQPSIVAWINRLVGSAFIAFGALLLSLRRQSV